jgi:hypothetical protein
MDAHAQFYALILWHLGIAFRHSALNLNSVTRGIDDAGKFNENAIASAFDNTASMFSDLWFPKFASNCVDPRERAFFVGTH